MFRPLCVTKTVLSRAGPRVTEKWEARQRIPPGVAAFWRKPHFDSSEGMHPPAGGLRLTAENELRTSAHHGCGWFLTKVAPASWGSSERRSPERRN